MMQLELAHLQTEEQALYTEHSLRHKLPNKSYVHSIGAMKAQSEQSYSATVSLISVQDRGG
jgi:hypothetical protein